MFDPRLIIVAIMAFCILYVILVFGTKYLEDNKIKIANMKRVVLYCPIKDETETLINIHPEEVLKRIRCDDCDKKEECQKKNLSRIIKEQTS